MDGFDWRERDGVRWLQADLPGARAAFSTRLGGVSDGPFATLNLGNAVGDDPGAVSENRARLAAALGLEADLVGFARQVHGGELAAVEATAGNWLALGPDEPVEADGQVVKEPGRVGLVFVADCVPIVVAGADGVAVLHGGWRGLAAGIVAAGVAAVSATAAAVGPSIGPCCYEVGEEVLGSFAELGPGHAEGPRLNLWAVTESLLERAGVGEVRIAGLCTRCNPELLFSHRGAGPRTGRQAGVGWIDEDGDDG